ncbi:Aste57867_15286 [Aphanomyces stellatus]|uniref:Aste57867_15286 protein n=1 Tax=Aphanomyces stellatus TaxID=120398 RepID=A0A485L4M3_9STRA|nr:hypothetical protein As57867_015230 [Aphanomyces stellatus]VFT92095.1 Aste57867_15286 [Aphanomyces stellatus]
MKNVLVRVALFCGLFAVQCVTVLGSVTRDTLFLRVYDSRYISHMVLIMSFATAYASTAISQLQQRGFQSTTIACTFPLVSAVVMVAFWVVLIHFPSLLYISSIGLYMWVEISVQLLAQQFWDICSSAFSISESKQYFGAITFGSTIGTLLASFGLIPIMRTYDVSTEGTVVVVAALQSIIGVAMFAISPLFQVATKATSKAKPAMAGASTSVVSEIQRRSYLKHVCFFEFGATVVRVFVDYSTLAILGQYNEETVKYALGSINGAQSFLMMPLQLLSGPLFTYFGVMYGIATLPLAIVLFGCATYASSSYLLLIASRAFYNSVTYAIFNPARELLWLPLHATDRGKFKSFVTGPFRSLARVVGALLSMVLTSDTVTFYCGSTAVSATVIALGVTWFIDALAARQAYAAEFYASLKKGHMDVTSHWIDFTTDQIDLVQSTLRRSESNRIAFVLSFIQPAHVPMFHTDLRDVFYRKDASVLSLPTKLKLLQLHVAYKRQPRKPDDAQSIFCFDDLMALYKDTTSPRQLRLAAILACGYGGLQAVEPLQSCLEAETDVSLTVGAAIAVLRSSQWMDEKSTLLLQRLLHEPPDVKAKVICLRIVGKELPELLGNGYLVYLLHQSQEARIVHAALECCRQSKRTSAMLVPALIKWLADASFRAEALDALLAFPPALVWDNLVDFLEKALASHSFEATLGGVRLLEMGQFPANAKLDFVLNMMDSLMDQEDEEHHDDGGSTVAVNLGHVLVLSHRLPLWEVLADAMIRAAVDTQLPDELAKRLDRIVTAYVVKGYQLSHLRALLDDGQVTHALLPQVLECALDILLRVALKLVSAKFPRGFNIYVLIEGLHSDVPEVLSAVQEVLETLLPSHVKHTLVPLLFPHTLKAPAALQMEKDVRALQSKSGLALVEDAMTDSTVDVELSCLAMEHYLGLVSALRLKETIVLPEAQAQRLVQHSITKEMLVRALANPATERTKALQRLFGSISLPEETATSSSVPLTFFDVVTSLRSCALFRSINVIELVQTIALHFSQVVVLADSVFVVEGDVASHMHVIASGTVQLHQHNGALLATLQAGACVGELAVLTSKGTHPASATALSDCVLLGISRASLHALIHSNAGIARGVVDALASALKWSYMDANATHFGDSHRLRRLVSQVSITTNVNKAANALLSKIGRHRSKSDSPPKDAQKVLANEKPLLQRASSKSHLRDYSSLRLNAQDFADGAASRREVQYTHLEKCLHLKASQFMKDVDDDHVAAVAQMAQVVVLEHDQVLFQDGAPATSMYVVVEGTIVCTAARENEGERSDPKRDVYESGDAFGELSFSRGATHLSTATAESAHLAVVVLEIPTTEFIELAEKHIKLLHLVLAWLSRKITTKMNFPQDFHLPLAQQPMSPIGSPCSSPRHAAPSTHKVMWSDDPPEDINSVTLRQRQMTI